MRSLAADAQTGLSLGLFLSALAFGFRHGIDWDHFAAITDIAASQDSPREGVILGTLYAVGHAAIVFVIGVVVIALGTRIPESADQLMGRIVGVTLILLGVYVLYGLARYRRDFRMRSRWMLLFSAVRRGLLWLRKLFDHETHEELEHDHLHAEGVHHEHAQDAPEVGEHAGPQYVKTHRHTHKHSVVTDPFMNYGRGTAVTVGMLHGVGAETPTQVTIFLAAAGAGAAGEGLVVLGLFLVGLFAANALITVGSAYGYLAAGKQFAVYATVSILTGVVSLVIGVLFVLGKETLLPVFFGG